MQRPVFRTDWLRVWAASALGVLALLVVAVWWLDLLPPTKLSLAAGRPGGAYHATAERYRRILARDGIELRIVETAGSVENAALLSGPEPAVDAAFLQGGVPVPGDASVEPLAAIFLEPFWVFHRGSLEDPTDPTAWRDLVIAAGEPGGGTRFAVQALFDALDLDPAANTLAGIGGSEGAEALLAGQVDVALFVAPADALYLQRLFESETAKSSSIRDSEAIARRLDFVQLADIPPAGLDYAERNPTRRIELIAMVGRLVARKDLHPALVDRLMHAAQKVHSGRDLVTAEDQFPTTAGLEKPVNSQAASIIAGPPSPLYDFLPYWVVAQIESFLLLLVPVLVLLVPLMRAIPGIYRWRMRARVYNRYLDLLEIDRQVPTRTDLTALAPLERQLAEIEAEVVRLRLPLQYREYAYTMRLHIDLVRRRLADRHRELEAAGR